MMELDLTWKGNADGSRDWIVARPEQTIVFDLAVRAVRHAQALPRSLTIRTQTKNGPSAASLDAPLMQADKLFFYRCSLQLPKGGWWREQLRIEAAPGTPPATDAEPAEPFTANWTISVLSLSTVQIALVVLFFALVPFAWRIVPLVHKFAPTTANVVFGLFLQGAPAILLGGIVVGIVKDALPRFRSGDVSVFGMRRPETILAIAAIIVGVAMLLPLAFAVVHNRSKAQVRANWSPFEMVDFPSRSWVSMPALTSLDEDDARSLFLDYDARLCAVHCDDEGPVGLGGCLPAASAQKACEHRVWASSWLPPTHYHVLCRQPHWDFKGPLTELRNASGVEEKEGGPPPKIFAIATTKDGCEPESQVEGTAHIDHSAARVAWSESAPPTQDTLAKYVAKHLTLRLDAGVSEDTTDVRIRSVPPDPETLGWLRWIDTRSAPQERTHKTPEAPDARRMEFTVYTPDKASPAGTLHCARTDNRALAIGFVRAERMSLKSLELSGNGVSSYWSSPEGASFAVACYDPQTTEPPESATVTMTTVNDGAHLSFGKVQVPRATFLFEDGTPAGRSVCVGGTIEDRQKAQLKRPKNGTEGKGLVSATDLQASYEPPAGGSAGLPWLCVSGAVEQARVVDLQPRVAIVAASASARATAPPCCFSSGERVKMSCQTEGWVCNPVVPDKRYEDWYRNKGCDPGAVRECYLAAQ